MIRFSRFERRIFTAILAVAIVPLAGTLILGQGVLREAYQVGVNPQVREELEKGLELYRAYFIALRNSAELVANGVSTDKQVNQALETQNVPLLQKRLRQIMGSNDHIARIEVLDTQGNRLAGSETAERLNRKKKRLLELNRSISTDHQNHELKLTIATDSDLFDAYQTSGELVKVFSRLQEGTYYVSGFFLAIYIGFLLTVIVLALLVGIVISRRVTRRVAILADATAKVGAGDLSVKVPSDTKDEIGELTKAFNIMVRDIRESRDRIEYLQRIGAWQEFARRLAHEIKNPLTPIQLAVQEIHRSYSGNDSRYKNKLSEMLSIVEEEVATLRRLVGEFSSFAKLPEVRLAPADLNEFVQDASRSRLLDEDISKEGDEPNVPIEMKWELSEESIMVNIDAMMLKRCIDNLVRNSKEAILQHFHRMEHSKFEPGYSEGDETTRGIIQIRTRTWKDLAIIDVDDNGPGISEEQRNLVFSPYYTTKKDGTGLGLAIVKKVVLEHGGTMVCTKSFLGGVSFQIQLPRILDGNKKD